MYYDEGDCDFGLFLGEVDKDRFYKDSLVFLWERV